MSLTRISSYRSFRDAGNRYEGRLRKTELKLRFLCEVVIGAVFRRLFYGIAHPKALLFWGDLLLYFFPPVQEVKQSAVARV